MKKQRKRSEQVGPNKHSINSLDTKGPQGLQWEYSKDDLTLYDNGEKQPNPVSLETIYQSIMEHREESKSESRRTQAACHKMQIQIRRVAKTLHGWKKRRPVFRIWRMRLDLTSRLEKLWRNNLRTLSGN
ncbi:hypothetical protein NDU88_001795 [Pleurodeles waltl]|uniref:Uncharacterized protein n=1 Tax=Pleurodeles waltl TaxID=8319 RepID=A0AAV7WLZ9_PLEWA|nr:hypothetical protein NDU88_001795 [Pleurodeles waltl]